MEELTGEVDFAVALHMVHEVPDQASFFTDVWQALKPDGKLLVIEPKGHVSQDQFEQTIDSAKTTGFEPKDLSGKVGGREILLMKPHM